MAQMSILRQKLFGYKLVSIENFNDVSYMSSWDIEHMMGIPFSYWRYMNKHGKTVTKTVEGHWKLESHNHKGDVNASSDKTLS